MLDTCISSDLCLLGTEIIYFIYLFVCACEHAHSLVHALWRPEEGTSRVHALEAGALPDLRACFFLARLEASICLCLNPVPVLFRTEITGMFRIQVSYVNASI